VPASLCRPCREPSRAHPRGKPGFSTYEGGFGRETDSPLEGDGFEPSVPRVMDGDLGRQVPALIAFFEQVQSRERPFVSAGVEGSAGVA
jgi:hypothetical protein